MTEKEKSQLGLKDIPSGVIAAGNPCKVIRKITEDDKHKYKRN
ncbi:hypothetical protein ACXHJ2_11385 [Paenibacillus sp. ALE3]|nr:MULTISPECIES: hypothetical protein [Paenibacillus]MEE4570386.1 hypothetical protein [Paenibacillus polymyxa]WPQ59104.1 hypothetical protein SKN87_11820 [Paenibacillus polymyxa]